jgi:hypothetical protein
MNTRFRFLRVLYVLLRVEPTVLVLQSPTPRQMKLEMPNLEDRNHTQIKKYINKQMRKRIRTYVLNGRLLLKGKNVLQWRTRVCVCVCVCVSLASFF